MADYNDKAHVTMEPMTREMQIPKGTKMIGIVGDNKSERVDIDIPRWYDGIDLGSKSIYIVVSNDNDQSDTIIPEIKKDEEQLHLTWVVKSKHVSSEGTVYAHILATDTSGFKWQSLDGEYEVKTVNDGPESMPDTQVTAVEQKLVEMDAAKLQAINAAAAALSSATATAPPIIPDASGLMAIMATDSADRPLRGLTIYGRTTQDGVPSEDAPVDLMGAGMDSPLRIVTAGKNLAAMTQKVPSYAGITSSYDAQSGTITVAGTATGVSYVSYWLREFIPAGTPLLIGFCNQTTDKNITVYAFSQSEDKRTQFASLNLEHVTVQKTFDHAFEFIGIRVADGATVNMTMKMGMMIGSDITDYEWTKPDEPTSAQIVMPGWHFSVGGLLQGLPAVSGGNYTDENGQEWITDTVEYDAETGTAQIVKRVESVMYDGSEDEKWAVSPDSTFFYIILTKKISTSHGLCTHYPANNIALGGTNVGFSAMTSATTIRFRPADYATITLDAWRARLDASPVTVLYALDVPEIMPITGDELAELTALRSRYPATTAFNDAGAQMSVRYVADTKNYVDQRIEQLTNAVVSTGANI